MEYDREGDGRAGQCNAINANFVVRIHDLLWYNLCDDPMKPQRGESANNRASLGIISGECM